MKADLQAFTRSHQVALFFVLTIAVSWTIYGVEFAVGSPPIALGVFGPLLAAAVLTWATGGSLRRWGGQLFIWRVDGRWYLIVLVGFPVVFVGASTAIYAVLTGYEPDLGVLPERAWIVLFFLVFQILYAGLGEELGWRGFALPRLQDRYNALMASLIIGFFWALWHLPLFFQPDSYQAQMGPLIYLIDTFTISILFTWLYNSTGGSVLIATLFHGVFNTTLVLYPYEADLDIAEFPFLLGASRSIAMLVLAVLVVAVYGGRKLTNRESIPDTEHTGGVPANRSSTSEMETDAQQ
ncbi:type II CAAX endopeptidase family protein [Natronolimnohabitans sp. A-GB9]|uniref:type II CAAX endopeptidase family protein n=1 Tax=Natronolimnohabitans sp. A-GB9 TaxID=3069757 RepID=UPI0027AE2ADE|nr:type II CAAX endopeptidase family protein [Natronolimnohabitans sp. A-GB9]MDQ2052184.1 type II CAAX endopeptidase family protein [Natronolimnohabitans sp. A-GB9]